MAASLVVMLPVLLLCFFLQRYFIQGVVFTGSGDPRLSCVRQPRAKRSRWCLYRWNHEGRA